MVWRPKHVLADSGLGTGKGLGKGGLDNRYNRQAITLLITKTQKNIPPGVCTRHEKKGTVTHSSYKGQNGRQTIKVGCVYEQKMDTGTAVAFCFSFL